MISNYSKIYVKDKSEVRLLWSNHCEEVEIIKDEKLWDINQNKYW